jgi:YcxB-like protein
MTIRFFLNWDEYFAAQEFFRRHRAKLAPEHQVSGVLLLVGAVLFWMGDGAGWAIVAGAIAASVGVTTAAPWLRRQASRRKWFREPLYQTEHTVAAGDEGVYFLMGKIESNLVWQYYQRFLESPEGFLLVYSGDSFNYLPKRAFAGADSIAAFRALAAKNLKQ